MPEANKFATHVTYHVEIGHNHSEGLVACPVAGPDPQKASILRLHAPFEVLSVNWTATREGAPPICPSYKAFFKQWGSYSNKVFLGGSRGAVESPTLGGHIWSASGVYNYIIETPEGLDSKMAVAKVPWDNAQTGDFYIPAENFLETGIINTDQPRSHG